MGNCLRKAVATGVAAIGLSVVTTAANADYLPGLTNLDFSSCNGGGACVTKQSFSSAGLDGWTGGSGLIFLDSGNNATDNPNGVWVGPGPAPTGGNYVQADGNPFFESGFNYQVHGLTAGTTYQLSFYQAAGQQAGFTGDTTEQWIVSLGTAGLTVPGSNGSCGNGAQPACQYVSSDGTASIVATNLMNTPSQGVSPWEFVSINLTADASDQVLSFLAWGDNGSEVNLPPMVFLSGVNSPDVLPGVPEPATLSLFGLGALGLGGLLRRRAGRA